jgi:hypothetical protein
LLVVRADDYDWMPFRGYARANFSWPHRRMTPRRHVAGSADDVPAGDAGAVALQHALQAETLFV